MKPIKPLSPLRHFGITTDNTSKAKRACNVCGQVHKGVPFTDCYSEKINGPLPDDLQQYYKDQHFENDDDDE